jgi:hypothetical protein
MAVGGILENCCPQISLCGAFGVGQNFPPKSEARCLAGIFKHVRIVRLHPLCDALLVSASAISSAHLEPQQKDSCNLVVPIIVSRKI